jgi:hypothetical protein
MTRKGTAQKEFECLDLNFRFLCEVFHEICREADESVSAEPRCRHSLS